MTINIYCDIEYIKNSSRVQKNGSIEVDVEFRRGDIYRYVTFVFADTGQVASDFDSRCQSKIDKFVEKRKRLRTLEEVEALILEYISNPENATVSADMMTTWRNEYIDVKGAI